MRRLSRRQMAHDRQALIADLDLTLARVAALEDVNHNLRRIVGERNRSYVDLEDGVKRVLDRITTEGASIEEVAEELAALTVPAQVARELRLVDNHEPRPALHLIRQRTGGGTA